MGLLDDVFGKNEINQLKSQLLETSNEILRLESAISEQNNSNNELAIQIHAQKSAC